MGKFNANPQKAGAVLQYFQKSRVAHSIKDLEKQLPSVASINGMQVKDYLQALSDDEKIHVEKIGSGNWYWSFASEDKNKRQKALDDAQVAYDKANAVVADLKQRLAHAQGQHEEEKGLQDAGGDSREEMVERQTVLQREKKQLEKELAAYSATDPTALERKRNEITQFKTQAEQFTDEIYAMESWFKNICPDEEGIKNLRASLYGDELDENDGVLRELMDFLPQSYFIAPVTFTSYQDSDVAVHCLVQSNPTPDDCKMDLDSPQLRELDEYIALTFQDATPEEFEKYQLLRGYKIPETKPAPAIPDSKANPAVPVFEGWIFAEDDTTVLIMDEDPAYFKSVWNRFFTAPRHGEDFPSPIVRNFEVPRIQESALSAQLPYQMSQLSLDGTGYSSESDSAYYDPADGPTGMTAFNVNHTATLSDSAVAGAELKTHAEIIASYRPMVLSNVSVDLELRFWTAQQPVQK